MTGRHRGPKRKLRAGVACAAHFCTTAGLSIQRSLMLASLYYTTVHYVANSIFPRRMWYRALSLRYACIQSSASSSPIGYQCDFRFDLFFSFSFPVIFSF